MNIQIIYLLLLSLSYLLTTVSAQNNSSSASRQTLKIISSNETIEITYIIQNFENIPYGKSVSGQIQLAFPDNTACTSLDQKFGQNPFILAKKEGCYVAQKARNAQDIGSKVLIIMDDSDGNLSSSLFAEDIYGDEVSIPTILITKTDGMKILNMSGNLFASLHFQKNLKADYIVLDFWISINQPESLKMVQAIEPIVEQFNNNELQFYPHYEVNQEGFEFILNEDLKSINCIFNGEYCVVNRDQYNNYEGASGSQILYEIVRQKCLFKVLPDQWFTYFQNFEQECQTKLNLIECGDTLMQVMNIDKQPILDCMNSSIIFTEATTLNDTSIDNLFSNLKIFDNTILRNEKKYSQNIFYWPQLQINGAIYKDDINQTQLQNYICDLYMELPESCSQQKDPLYQIKLNINQKLEQIKNQMKKLLSNDIAIEFNYSITDLSKQLDDLELNLNLFKTKTRESRDQIDSLIADFDTYLLDFQGSQDNPENPSSIISDPQYQQQIQDKLDQIRNELGNFETQFNNKIQTFETDFQNLTNEQKDLQLQMSQYYETVYVPVVEPIPTLPNPSHHENQFNLTTEQIYDQLNIKLQNHISIIQNLVEKHVTYVNNKQSETLAQINDKHVNEKQERLFIFSILFGSIFICSVLLCYLNCKANKLLPDSKNHSKKTATYMSEKKYSM